MTEQVSNWMLRIKYVQSYWLYLAPQFQLFFVSLSLNVYILINFQEGYGWTVIKKSFENLIHFELNTFILPQAIYRDLNLTQFHRSHYKRHTSDFNHQNVFSRFPVTCSIVKANSFQLRLFSFKAVHFRRKR